MENEANGLEGIGTTNNETVPQEWGPITADGLKTRGSVAGVVEYSAVFPVSIAADAEARQPSIARTLLVCSTAASQVAALFASAATFSAEGNNDARDAITAKAVKLLEELADMADEFSDE